MAKFEEPGQFKFKKVGNFLVGPRFAEGSFGEMRLAVHIGTREKVAIKVISKRNLVQLPGFQRHFRREIILLQRVRHPNIARFYGTMESNKCYYMVNELVIGGHLLGRVAVSGSLSEAECRPYMRQMVAAIDHLHSSDIVHRNLKLENFLLDQQNNIKLVGFGVCAECRNHDLQLGTHCVSPLYAAPELFAGKKYGKPVDIWSLGVCLYAMLLGRLPFYLEAGSSLTKLREVVLKGCHLPSFLSSECTNLLSKLFEPMDSLRLSSNVLITHTWLVSASDIKQSHNSRVDENLANSTLLRSECDNVIVIDHQNNNSEQYSASENQTVNVNMSNDKKFDECELTTIKPVGKIEKTQECLTGGSNVYNKNDVSKLLAQISEGGVGSSCNSRTVSGNISCISSSYKSNLLQLKRLRQSLTRSSPTILSKSDNFTGSCTRVLSGLDNRKSATQNVSENYSDMETFRNASIDLEAHVSLKDSLNDMQNFKNLIIQGKSLYRANTASAFLSPLNEPNNLHNDMQQRHVTETSAIPHIQISDACSLDKECTPITSNSAIPSVLRTPSFTLEATNFLQDNQLLAEHNSQTNEMRKSALKITTFATDSQMKKTSHTNIFPRDIMRVLRDPFSRDDWCKIMENWQPCKSKRINLAQDGSRKPQICGQLTQRLHTDAHKTNSLRGDVVNGPDENVLTNLSVWRSPIRELTTSPRPDLEDFLTPVTRVVIIHS